MERAESDEINRRLARCPAARRRVVQALRRTVLDVVPDVNEGVRFNALCYFRPDQPFGAIGGNVCMIECRKDGVVLSFIHGAQLSDTEGLLRGRGKAKRYVPVGSVHEARRGALRRLIHDAATLPGTEVK